MRSVTLGLPRVGRARRDEPCALSAIVLFEDRDGSCRIGRRDDRDAGVVAVAAVHRRDERVELGDPRGLRQIELEGLAWLEQHAALYAGFMPARASLGFAGDVPGLVPVILTPLSATLVHGGPVHLAFNLVTLVYCGVATERALGSRGIVVLYLLGAYAACVAQWAVGPQSPVPMIGASGAASAIIGAYALLYREQFGGQDDRMAQDADRALEAAIAAS